MLVSHSVTQLVTSEPGHSSEEPAPHLFPSHFHAAWTDDGSGVDWWHNLSRLRIGHPCNFSMGLFYHRWHQSRVSHQVNLEQSREQESVLLIRPYM